jgi:hypothetical protein
MKAPGFFWYMNLLLVAVAGHRHLTAIIAHWTASPQTDPVNRRELHFKHLFLSLSGKTLRDVAVSY